jgi:AraC-like DNA-binding protein
MAIRAPFEANAFSRWREITRAYRRVVYRAMARRDRARWMRAHDVADFRVFSAGYFEKAQGHFGCREGLNEGVFIYCAAGKGWYREGGRKWLVYPGQLLYGFPRTRHAYGADRKDPWTIYWLHASGPRLRTYERALGLSRARPVLSVGVQPESLGLFHALFACFKPAYRPADFLAIQGCAQHILSAFASAPKYPLASVPEVAKVQAVVRLMRESVGERRDLAFFARAYGTSAAHFVRIFRRLQGAPPMRVFNRLKIERACEHLTESGAAVKQAALAVGFRDPAHFSRAFKRVVGHSPERYRASLFGGSGCP